MLHRTIVEKREAISALCARHHVRRLEVFGSAVTGRFDPTRSDLDFLVEFEPLSPGAYSDAYFELLHSLEDLFERPIDLVSTRSLTNPYFIREIEQHRTVLYAA